MYLKSIEIRGFKSFADRTLLNFKDGITAVVGPNGSGKSNISDAVRWVLGEQKIKSLRGGKMEDVIFSGTDFRKPLGFAEVTLLMDNSGKSLPIASRRSASQESSSDRGRANISSTTLPADSGTSRNCSWIRESERKAIPSSDKERLKPS